MNDQLSGLRPAQRDVLRLVGAVTIAAGIFILLIRKSEEWSDFWVLLLLALPCALFYGLGIGAVRLGPDDPVEPDPRPDADPRGLAPWRATALVLGIVFVPLALSQLVDTIGGDSDKSGWVFLIFLATAAAAAYAAVEHGLRYGVLLAGLAVIVSWVALWDAIISPSATGIRWLFVLIGAALGALAYLLDRAGRREAPELVTAAGVAGLAAGITALFALFGGLFGSALGSVVGSSGELSGGVQQRAEWDFFLLVLALVLIWYGARAAWRGPAYVGALALFAFAISAGTDIASLAQGDEPSKDVIGWPLLLVVLGGAALAAGLLGGGPRGSERGAAPPPGDAPPTQPLPPDPA